MFWKFKWRKKRNLKKLILNSGLFDEEYYLKQNPDINIDALKHYCTFGIKENKKPNSLFDPICYLENNPDVQLDGMYPLIHYILYGQYENRLINASNTNADLEKNSLTPKDIKLMKKSPFWDQEFYLISNPDVKNSKIDPLDHYIKYGYIECRNPSKSFDTCFYLKNNPDVAEAAINPLLHYIKYGQHEGRDSVPRLITKDYPDTNKLLSIINHTDTKDLTHLISNTKPIDILIPVYNGIEYLKPLFDSISKNTHSPYRLLVCDDKSPDLNVLPLLESIKQENENIEFILLKNEKNLGFVGTVNKLVEHTNNHFVLLNTDTEVPPYWLERLMFPIFHLDNIATTTPFTNAGTICSFPTYLEDNEIINNLPVQDVDKYFMQVNFENSYIEIPTGIGFCMGVNKNLIDKIGMFDQVFGKGYGEENDLCQRAIAKGYKNLHVTNLFVYHKHGGSFPSEEKKRLINANLKTLNKRYPRYNKDIQTTINDNKLKNLRYMLYYMIQSSSFYSVLYIDHNLGGGAVDYRKMQLSDRIDKNQMICLITYDFKNAEQYIGKFMFRDDEFTFYAHDIKELFILLKCFNFDEIFLNSLVSYPDIKNIIQEIINMKIEQKSNLVIPLHDFFPLCPSYTLLNEQNKFCNIPSDPNVCQKCLQENNGEFKQFSNNTDIVDWRETWSKLIKYANSVLSFSYASKEIFIKAYPEYSKLVDVVPHDISGRYTSFYKSNKTQKELRIGILGGINVSKGALIVKELVEYIDQHNLNVKIVLIGDISIPIESTSFIKTGRYEQKELPKIVKKLNITKFFIPSIWPETFSYTTDEIMQMGYPLTVFDIGAPAERVKHYKLGTIINIDDKYKIFEQR